MEKGVLLVTGPGRAAKSLFLRQLVGLDSPRGGSVTIDAEHLYLDGRPPRSLLTVIEQLHIWAEGVGEPLIPAAVRYLALAPFADLPCHDLAFPIAKRLALAPLLLHPVALWLLDHSADGLDDEGVTLLRGLIASRIHKGGAIVMTCETPLGLFEAGTPLAILDLGDFR